MSSDTRIKLKDWTETRINIRILNDIKKDRKSTERSIGVTAKKDNSVSTTVTSPSLPAPNKMIVLDDSEINLRLYIRVDQAINIVRTNENPTTIESFANLTLKKGRPDMIKQPKTEFLQKSSVKFPKNN